MNITSLESILRVHQASDIVEAISNGTEKYEVVLKNKDGTDKIDDNGEKVTKERFNFNGLTDSYSKAESWLESDAVGYDSDG